MTDNIYLKNEYDLSLEPILPVKNRWNEKRNKNITH